MEWGALPQKLVVEVGEPTHLYTSLSISYYSIQDLVSYTTKPLSIGPLWIADVLAIVLYDS